MTLGLSPILKHFLDLSAAIIDLSEFTLYFQKTSFQMNGEATADCLRRQFLAYVFELRVLGGPVSEEFSLGVCGGFE